MKPSPSKKFRSGSSFSRRGAPSSNSCVTYQPSVSGELKAQVTTKAEVEPGQSQGRVPVWSGLPPSFLPSPCLLGFLLLISVQEKPSCYIFFHFISPTPFSLLFVYWFSSFLFSRRPLRSSWCFTSDSNFGESQWGLAYSWLLLFLTCSWRDFANAMYKVGSSGPVSMLSSRLSL